MKPLRIHLRHITMTGVSNENRTHDSGITTRGFATKLWTPYRNTLGADQTLTGIEPATPRPRAVTNEPVRRA
jgi:hypothetical protein